MRLILLLCALLCFANPAQALDTATFENLPIMESGRLKPMSSFARITLKQLSGETKLGDLSASGWLALTLFNPQVAAEIEVINIDNKTLIKKLELSTDKKLYSLTDLKPALNQTRADIETLLQKDASALTQNEQALLQLHENAATLTNLMRSFSALLPLEITLPQLGGQPNFIALAAIEKELETDLKDIITKKGNNPTKYSPQELTIAKASFQIQALRAGGQSSHLFRVIPASWDSAKGEWFSPWEVLLGGQGSPASAFLLSQWEDLATAYRAQNEPLWTAISQDLLDETTAQSENQINAARFKIEQLYRAANPFIWVLGLYALAFAAALTTLKKPSLKPAAIAIAAIGITAHIAAIAMRIYILDRPPVGTLYESILFVTLICTFIGLWISIKRNHIIPLTAGLLAAIALLLTAPLFEPKTDSLEVLVAVLNTNFWLTIHVLCITAGYGVCILSACLAHAALYIRNHNKDTWKTLQQSTYHTAIAALFLTTLGTVLGGIWADQSWGRFWGWDPKENGALLIVLWLIWALHGRVSGKLKPAAFLSVIAALNVVVAVSWFGVNLLNVGLHSYGFTSGLAGGLLAFCIIQSAAIIALYILANRKSAP